MTDTDEKLWVRTQHYRRCFDADGNEMLASALQIKQLGLQVSPKGGMTEVFILDKETEEVVAEGVAYVNPKDTFNKRLGRMIAVGRALLPPEERARRDVPVEERIFAN